MNLDWRNLWKYPGSTIKAALGLAIAITIALLALPPKASIGVVVLAILRAALGFMQKDVGLTEAVNPQTGAVGVKPSSEQPNDPNLLAVEQAEAITKETNQ